ncbi:MAG: hypothetical protein ACRCYP_07445 [Alphaproteobacteria bacterium]
MQHRLCLSYEHINYIPKEQWFFHTPTLGANWNPIYLLGTTPICELQLQPGRHCDFPVLTTIKSPTGI